MPCIFLNEVRLLSQSHVNILSYVRVLRKKSNREGAKGINTSNSLSSFLLVTCSSSPLAKPSESQKVYLEAVGCRPEPWNPSQGLGWCAILQLLQVFLLKAYTYTLLKRITIGWLMPSYLEMPGSYISSVTEEVLQKPCSFASIVFPSWKRLCHNIYSRVLHWIVPKLDFAWNDILL